MKKFRIIPFWMLPGSWGLSGAVREEQEARYYYEGYDLESRLAHIHLSGDDLTKRLLDLSLEYGGMTKSEHETRMAEFIADPVERDIALVNALLTQGEITAVEAEKQIATIRGEPWIKVVQDGIDMSEGANYFFEFDWNDLWITELRKAGYVGMTEEHIVQAWFQDMCRQEASASLGAPPINGGIFRG